MHFWGVSVEAICAHRLLHFGCVACAAQVWPLKMPPAAWAYPQKRMLHFLKTIGMAFIMFIQVCVCVCCGEDLVRGSCLFPSYTTCKEYESVPVSVNTHTFFPSMPHACHAHGGLCHLISAGHLDVSCPGASSFSCFCQR